MPLCRGLCCHCCICTLVHRVCMCRLCFQCKAGALYLSFMRGVGVLFLLRGWTCTSAARPFNCKSVADLITLSLSSVCFLFPARCPRSLGLDTVRMVHDSATEVGTVHFRPPADHPVLCAWATSRYTSCALSLPFVHSHWALIKSVYLPQPTCCMTAAVGHRASVSEVSYLRISSPFPNATFRFLMQLDYYGGELAFAAWFLVSSAVSLTHASYGGACLSLSLSLRTFGVPL